jgi:hypothetical protein
MSGTIMPRSPTHRDDDASKKLYMKAVPNQFAGTPTMPEVSEIRRRLGGLMEKPSQGGPFRRPEE